MQHWLMRTMQVVNNIQQEGGLGLCDRQKPWVVILILLLNPEKETYLYKY